MKTKTKLALLTCIGFAGALHAQTLVNVPNGSFEDPQTTDFSHEATGWVTHTTRPPDYYTVGVQNASVAGLTGATGDQVAVLCSSVALWSASDLLVMQAGDTYTLKVDLAGIAGFNGFTVGLFDSTTSDPVVIALALEAAYGVAPDGSFLANSGTMQFQSETDLSTYTLSYTVADNDPAIGHGLRIMMAAQSEIVGYADNVRLQVNSIPEPSAALLGCCGVTLALLRRRRFS